MKKFFIAFTFLASFFSLSSFSEENYPLRMGELYNKMEKSAGDGNYSTDYYYEYCKIQNAFTSGSPGNTERSSASEIHSAWSSVLKDFELYWKDNCPMENYSVYKNGVQLKKVGQTRPGGTADFCMDIDWKESRAFLYMREAIKTGLKKAYDYSWKDIPEAWPNASVFSLEKNSSLQEKLLAEVCGQTGCASYFSVSGQSLYEVSLDIIDRFNSKVLFKGSLQILKKNGEYMFFDVPEEVADLVQKGKTSVKVSSFVLHYGKASKSFPLEAALQILPSYELTPPVSLTKGLSQDALEYSKRRFFSANEKILKAIKNSDSYSLQKELDKYFVNITGAVFLMGSNKNAENEFPAHQVKIDSYKMMSIEIPQWLYKAVTGESPVSFTEDSLPAERISWHKAVLFCNRLSELAGLEPCYSGVNKDSLGGTGNVKCNFNANGYRLPTEAEWEYAAKAFTSGNQANQTLYSGGNSAEDFAVTSFSSKRNGPAKVASLKPNSWGLYDMSGNVWEWCSDVYGEYKAGYAENPAGAQEGEGYVLRGGSWASSYSPKTKSVDECRTSFRRCENGSDAAFSTYSSNIKDRGLMSIGFRICRGSGF